jgi:glycosyltransferase involved in cell wall biosynthesis
VPNKIFNLLLRANLLRLENLYGHFDALWLPDLRPFAIKPKTKLVLSVHDLSPVLHPEFYSRRRRIWHWLLNYKKSFARADLIFAVSEYTKYDLVKIFDLDPKKIEVVYPGIDHKQFHANLDQRLKHKVREKYNLPEKYILAVSTIEPRKNLSGLVEAFEHVEDPELHLVFAGRLGWLYRDFLERLAHSPKKAKIKLLGYIPEQDKPFLISQAEMLCYPSFYEGFGFQPLEAMACGVPVITSARTAMPEISGDAALLVEPSHLEDLSAAIKSLLEDQKLRAELVGRGLARSAAFSWERSAEKMLAALRKL